MSITQTAKVIFCPKQNKVQISILLAFEFLHAAGDMTASNYLPYIQMGYPLCWRAVMLAVLQAMVYIITGIGGMAVTFVWNKFNYKQDYLLFIALTSMFISYVTYGVAKTTVTMMLGVVLGLFSFALDPTIYALGAKMVAPEDKGNM